MGVFPDGDKPLYYGYYIPTTSTLFRLEDVIMFKRLSDYQILNVSKKSLVASMAFLVFLAVSNCVAQQTNNYFKRIAMVSDGRVTRFTKFPITVYVEGMDTRGKEYADDLRYALREWEQCSSGILKFQQVDLPDGADISVSWVNKMEADDQDHPLGVAELQRTNDDKFKIEMRICLRDWKTNKPLTHDQIKTILLHEFGHALGLWGHSKDKEDVMYYAANALHPTSRDINTLKAIYSHENNYSLHAESIKAIRQEMRSKLEDARLHFLLGTVQLDQGEYSQAIDSLKKSLSLNPRFHKASAALASAYRAGGQDQDAIVEYMSLAESDPSATVYNIIGALYFEKGDMEEAIKYFKKALEMERTYEPARKNLYNIYLNKGKELIDMKMQDAAVTILLDSIELFPDKPDLYNTLGTAYSTSGQFEEAIRQYSKALQINPAFISAKKNMASCYNNQGVKYVEAGQWEKAIGAYTNAMRLMPEMEEARKNLSAAYWNRAVELSKEGKNAEAIKAYQEFLVREPDSRDVHNNLGAIYFRMGDHEAAVAEFEKALKLGSADKNQGESEDNVRLLTENLVIAHQKRGLAFFEKKSYFRAEQAFKKGLELAPDNVNLHLSLAQVYLVLERWDNAAKYVDKALKLDPNNVPGRKMMVNLNMQQGYSYFQRKDYERSLEYFSKIPADLMPQDEASQKNLVIIEKQFGQVFSNNRTSWRTKDRLVRLRLSLAVLHMNRDELIKAKAVLKSAVDLKPQDRDVRSLLTEGCEKLREMLTKRGAGGEAREIANWVKQLRVGR